MSNQKPQPEAQLAEQAEALTLYLEALFADKPASLPVPVVAPVARPVIDLPATALRVISETPAPAAATAVATATPPAPPVTATVPQTATGVESATGDRPDWAQEPFPCLLLKVHGLALALPLVKLHRILDWTDPTPIPGYRPWLLGMVHRDNLERNLKVVDTGQFIIPERLAAAKDPAAGGNGCQHIVMIGDGEWGLTCEDVSEILTIDPDKVRWRSSRGKRPWLAGTIVEHLCALLDAEQLAAMLSAGAPDLPR